VHQQVWQEGCGSTHSMLRGRTISHRLFAHSCPLLSLHAPCAGGGGGRGALLEVEPRLEHQQLVGQARAEPGGTLSGLKLWLTTVAGWRKGVQANPAAACS
jgi:hypothetical protein